MNNPADEYYRKLKEKIAWQRSVVIKLKLDRCLTIKEMAEEMEMDWITLQRFILIGPVIKAKTMKKIQLYLEKQNVVAPEWQ